MLINGLLRVASSEIPLMTVVTWATVALEGAE